MDKPNGADLTVNDMSEEDIQDLMNRKVEELAKREAHILNSLAAAFMSEVGCLPSEAEFVREVSPDGRSVRMFVRKKQDQKKIIIATGGGKLHV